MKVKELFNILNSMMLKGLDSDAEVWLEAHHGVEQLGALVVATGFDDDAISDDANEFRDVVKIHETGYAFETAKILVLSTHA